MERMEERRRAEAAEAVARAGRRRADLEAALEVAEADLRASVRAARAQEVRVPVRRVAELAGLSPTTVVAWTRPADAAADVDDGDGREGRADRMDAEALLEDGHTLTITYAHGQSGETDEHGEVIADPIEEAVLVTVTDATGHRVAVGHDRTLISALLALRPLGLDDAADGDAAFYGEAPF